LDPDDDDLDPEVLRDFDPESFVNCSGSLIAQRDRAAPGARVQLDATIKMIRQQWEEWASDDSLVKMAFATVCILHIFAFIERFS
jgi:hypothetical protein